MPVRPRASANQLEHPALVTPGCQHQAALALAPDPGRHPRSQVGSGRRLGLLAWCRRGNGFGLVAGGSEVLLSTLLGESVTRADLVPRGSGLAGGVDLG